MRLGYGVDLVVDQQATRLAKLGFDVTVVAIHADLVQPPRPYRLVVINRMMRVSDFGTEASMRHILSRCDVTADIWVLHTPPFYDWVGYLHGPVVVVEHGAPPGTFFDAEIGRQIDNMAQRRLQETYRRLLPDDAIVSISRSIHDWLPDNVKPFSTIIYHGCDHYKPISPIEASQVRMNLGVNDEDCLILWVGRLQLERDEQPYKGFQELLGLLPLVRQQVPNAKFVLAGRVSERDRFVLESRGISVLPNQSPEELARAYAAADVLVNLSKWEGFNLALLEAQFQGTPVVAYDLGPHSEIVRHNETGLLAKDAKDFFLSVVKIAADRTLRERLGKKAKEFAWEFNWDTSVASLVEVIEKCVSNELSRRNMTTANDQASESARTSAQRTTMPDEALTVRDLLRLPARDFVKLAHVRILGQKPDEAAEAFWLKQLAGSLDRRSVLLDMADLARERGLESVALSLRASLALTRAQRYSRLGAKALKSIGSTSSSVWLQLQDDVFVKHAFRVLLGREAEPEAVAGRVHQLRNGYSRHDVLLSIRCSDEGRNRPLGDPGLLRILGQRGGIHAVEKTRSLVDWMWDTLGLTAISQPVLSNEWFDLGNEEFVRRAYRALLGREAEGLAVEGRVNQLLNGSSRRAILAEIRFSEEGRNRTLNDPGLRRILFGESLRQAPVLGWFFWDRRRPTVRELEDSSRQLRRLDARQRAFKSDLGKIGGELNQVLGEIGRLRDAYMRDNEQKQKIDNSLATEICAPRHGRDAGSFPDSPSNAEETVSKVASREAGYAILVAPGAAVTAGAVPQLLRAARLANSDIILGNEIEILDRPPFKRLKAHGPFSHFRFLRKPDLGGVVAVRGDLLRRIGVSSGAVLTGALGLQLIARAHTIAHVPVELCERRISDTLSNCPTLTEVQHYIGGIGREASVALDSLTGFDVRFTPTGPWKVGIIVISMHDEGELERSVIGIQATTEPQSYHILKVHRRDASTRAIEPLSESDGSSSSIIVPSAMPYGQMVNEAEKCLPPDCNLVVVMDAGVRPTAADWLPRLAESAMNPIVGVVAPKTIYANGRVRHAGMALGGDEICRYVARLVGSEDVQNGGYDVYLDYLNGLREVTIASHHCMMFRRSVFVELGRFEEKLGIESSDIDYCCRLRLVDMSILVDGRVTMVQPDPSPRWTRSIPPAELGVLKTKHAHLFSQGEIFWTPMRGAVDSGINNAEGIRIVRVPPLVDR
ncbi:MAG: glycosyltransferase [Proteobacteria bacterium]|nr:glycosyltransferase [Pseudomonadota bacterium]